MLGDFINKLVPIDQASCSRRVSLFFPANPMETVFFAMEKKSPWELMTSPCIDGGPVEKGWHVSRLVSSVRVESPVQWSRPTGSELPVSHVCTVQPPSAMHAPRTGD